MKSMTYLDLSNTKYWNAQILRDRFQDVTFYYTVKLFSRQ